MLFIFLFLAVICVSLIVVFYGYRFTAKQEKWIIILLIISLAVIGSFLVPKVTYDLSRHYDMINQVRGSADSLGQFLKEGIQEIDMNYKYTYVYNIMVYFIAKFLPNQALPFITILIVYGVFAYIAFREFVKERNNNRNFVISLAIFSVLMPYIMVYSNIRNPLASALVAYGVYRLFKDKKLVVFIIFIILAVLIHPVSFAIVPFIILSRFKPGIIGMVITVSLPLIVNYLMEFFRTHPSNDFLFRISAKYYNYTHTTSINQGRVFWYSIIIVLILLVALDLCANRGKKNHIKDRNYFLLNMVMWYSFFSLGYFNNYQMMLRLPYTIAFLSPVIVSNDFTRDNNISALQRVIQVLATCGVCLLAILGVYENVAWLT